MYYNSTLSVQKLHHKRAPVKTWFHRFKKSDADDVHSLLQTKEGYLILGDTSPSDRNSFIKAFDFDAKELWNKVFQSNINSTLPVGLELNSTYLISYRSILGDTRQKANVITGFNLTIDKQTHRVLDRSSQVFNSIAASKEGYLASGDHNRLFSYNKAGKLLWEKRYSRGDFFTGINTRYAIAKYKISRGQIKKVIGVEDDCFVVLGRVKAKGAKRASPWLFKVDRSGTLLWEKLFQNDYRYPSDLSLSKDGTYLVLFNDSRHRQIGCQKYNKEGALLWSKNYTNHKKSLLWNMAQTADGGHILTGSTPQKKYVKIMWLLKIDTEGKLLWQKKRHSTIGDFPSAIISTLDGGVLIGGKTTQQGNRVEKIYKGHVLKQFKLLEEGAWLLKLDSDGRGSDEHFTFEATQEWKEI